MKFPRIDSLTVIGYGLSLLYGVSFWWYLEAFRQTEFWGNATILAIMFLILFCNSFFVVRHLEFSRQILLWGNAIMALYLLAWHHTYAQYVQIGYVYINLALILFFNMKRIRVIFTKDWDSLRKCVLVIDDDEGLQKIMKRILLNNGFSVLSALTGERGLQVAKMQKPDLIILDVLLPGMKGRDVCRKIKQDEDTRHIPVIFLTAKDSPDDVQAEREAGAKTHITKPVNSKTLIAQIKKHIN